jgi:hypothetical protein
VIDPGIDCKSSTCERLLVGEGSKETLREEMAFNNRAVVSDDPMGCGNHPPRFVLGPRNTMHPISFDPKALTGDGGDRSH